MSIFPIPICSIPLILTLIVNLVAWLPTELSTVTNTGPRNTYLIIILSARVMFIFLLSRESLTGSFLFFSCLNIHFQSERGIETFFYLSDLTGSFRFQIFVFKYSASVTNGGVKIKKTDGDVPVTFLFLRIFVYLRSFCSY